MYFPSMSNYLGAMEALAEVGERAKVGSVLKRSYLFFELSGRRKKAEDERTLYLHVHDTKNAQLLRKEFSNPTVLKQTINRFQDSGVPATTLVVVDASDLASVTELQIEDILRRKNF